MPGKIEPDSTNNYKKGLQNLYSYFLSFVFCLLSLFFRRMRSFGYAFKGIYELVKSEANARIHLVATIIALSAGFVFHISKTE